MMDGWKDGRIHSMTWEYKTIAGQPHRKKRNKVQAMWLGEWCTIPKEMWDWKYVKKSKQYN